MQHCSEPDSIAAIEAQALERLWFEGKLQPLVDRLFVFVARNREDILALAGNQPFPAAVSHATQQLIAERRTVDLAAELRDQMEEIHKEIWYHGERGDYDRERIKREWIELHAVNWRNWLVKEYVFVAGNCAGEIAAQLASGQTDSQAGSEPDPSAGNVVTQS